MTTQDTQIAKSDMNVNVTSLSPVLLSYIASLRAIAPRKPKSAFAWAQIGCNDTDAFLCLAASNPEGRFFAVLKDAATAERSQRQASARRVGNATFLNATNLLRDLDYIVCDQSEASMTRAQLAELAQTALRPNGLLAYRYHAYPNADETLRFVVNEFGPEMSVEEARVFLQELKALGPNYFSNHPIAAAALDKAIAQQNPDLFFSTCSEGERAASQSFNTLIDMGTHGMAYMGDADIRKNYLDLSAPKSSHPILVACQNNYLYEPIKDFVMQRLDRCDVWCRLPVEQTDNLSVLFNDFTFGITMSREAIPSELSINDNIIRLDQGIYPALIEMMTTMPICIGDFLHHTTGAGIKAEDAVEAIQLLVSLGIAAPMRTSYTGELVELPGYPRWETGYNKYLSEAIVSTSEVQLASPVVGASISVPARDALVIQAINRAGLKDSVSALMPELQRIANDTTLSNSVMGTNDLTPEGARDMVIEVVERSMIRWYAYGLLAA